MAYDRYVPEFTDKDGHVYGVMDAENREETANLKSALTNHNVYVYPLTRKDYGLMAGITYTYLGGNTYQVSGKTTGISFYNAYNPTLSELGASVGDVVYCHAESSDLANVRMELWVDKGGTLTRVRNLTNEYYEYKIPTDTTKLLYRIFCPNNAVQFTATVKCEIISAPKENLLNFALRPGSVDGSLPDGTDLNTITDSGAWVLSDTNTYTNIPASLANTGEYLISLRTANHIFQFLYRYPSNNRVQAHIRVRNLNNSNGWQSWRVLTMGEFNIVSDILGLGDNPDFPEYHQSDIDLNSIAGRNKFYLCSDSYTYSNKPTGWTGVGFLMCVFAGSWNLQLVIPFSGNRLWKRRGNAAGTTWEAWQEITSNQNTYNVTNEYTFPEYSQSITQSVSPSITADTNDYLAPTGDNTDRTADILAMLTAKKICRLGAGNYYINGLQMPDESSIIGSGSATQIILSGSSDGFAIKPGSYCTLSDFMLKGSLSVPTFGENIGGRHGILWQGTYTENQRAPYLLRISNIYIANFTGGGITCYDTGYGTSNGIEATNIFIKSCWAGLNISYWSEFHKYTNVRCWQCRIGCVNNGGNNVFVNCDFSSNLEIAMLMDNSAGQSPNNSHGSCIGCVFNHTASNGASNAGIGIEMLNCYAGFIFSGCQIFFSKIHLEDSPGVVFANCNFGYSNCDIEVSGGKGILFSGNIHQDKAPITISNGAEVHFVNCYNRTTGALIEP